mmetsp:Transcript_74238/g.187674  ORF Transcript_74238/g.187674 Transcript_74238/m.187674 type:complete len:81 (-) Transcript_74238:38-280(-)
MPPSDPEDMLRSTQGCETLRRILPISDGFSLSSGTMPGCVFAPFGVDAPFGVEGPPVDRPDFTLDLDEISECAMLIPSSS